MLDRDNIIKSIIDATYTVFSVKLYYKYNTEVNVHKLFYIDNLQVNNRKMHKFVNKLLKLYFWKEGINNIFCDYEEVKS